VELPSSVTQVTIGETTYYVVGTAHVSRRSVDEVREAIAAIEPDVVCVELDPARLAALTKESSFRDLDIFKVVREGRTLYLLTHLALAAYQRRIGATLGVKPGTELLAAVDAAKERGIPVALVDRDINITLKRTWRNIGMWQRMKLLASLVAGGDSDDPGGEITADTVEDLKETQALNEMLTELARALPQVKGPLIDERDAYLASKTTDAGAGKRKVVAVVGAAHVLGMVPKLGTQIDRAPLEVVPPPALWWRLAKWIVPVAILGLVILFALRSDPETFARAMLAWMVPTMIGAGAFTLIAGGTVLSVVAATLVSPIARIYPLVRTGIVVGIVEAWRRKPSVADCERLADIDGFKAMRRNPVTRIIIVAVASSLGALIGFGVGVGVVASVL
jgi:pheromone shutdown-related protein TraB